MVEVAEDDPVGRVTVSVILVREADPVGSVCEGEGLELRESAVAVPDTEIVRALPLIEVDHVAKDWLLVPAVKDAVSVSMVDE
jgi:hypothetical protein